MGGGSGQRLCLGAGEGGCYLGCPDPCVQPDLPAVSIRPAHHLPSLISASIHQPPCQRPECPRDPSLFLSTPPCLTHPMGTTCPLQSAKREAHGVCNLRILTPALSTKAANINQGPTSWAPLRVPDGQVVICHNRGAGQVPRPLHSSWCLRPPQTLGATGIGISSQSCREDQG